MVVAERSNGTEDNRSDVCGAGGEKVMAATDAEGIAMMVTMRAKLGHKRI